MFKAMGSSHTEMEAGSLRHISLGVGVGDLLFPAALHLPAATSVVGLALLSMALLTLGPG